MAGISLSWIGLILLIYTAWAYFGDFTAIAAGFLAFGAKKLIEYPT